MNRNSSDHLKVGYNDVLAAAHREDLPTCGQGTDMGDMGTIHPRIRDLVNSLNPDREYAITRDLAIHVIVRRGHLRPGGPVAFYDQATGREIGLAFGGGGNFIRLNTHDVRRLQSAVQDGGSRHSETRETIRSLNAAAADMERPKNTNYGRTQLMGNMNRPGTIVVREVDHEPFIAAGMQCFVRELHWNGIDGLSFDVYRAEDGELLNNESFDDYPSLGQVESLIEDYLENGSPL